MKIMGELEIAPAMNSARESSDSEAGTNLSWVAGVSKLKRNYGD
jgi:hypothetical protein